MSNPIRSAVHELFATRENTLRGAAFTADASARGLIRRGRAVRQVGTVAAALVGVLALGAGVVAAVDHVSQGPVDPIGVPTPTAVPEPFTSVYFVPDGILYGMATWPMLPECGEPADFTPQSAHGLSVYVNEVSSLDRDGDFVLDVGFRNDGAEHLTFIALAPIAIFVKDGVVASPHNFTRHGRTSLDAAPGSAIADRGNVLFEHYQSCVYLEAQQAFMDRWPGEDASTEEKDAWLASGGTTEGLRLEPGEYTVYVWTPVMFGPHAAAARLWREAGFIEDVDAWTDASRPGSPFYGHEPVEHYCFTDVIDPVTNEPTRRQGELLHDPSASLHTINGAEVDLWDTGCDIPTEGLAKNVIVPTTYINDYAPTYIISEPVRFTVE